jgi:cysteine desulfurase
MTTYLDHNATTEPSKSVIAAVERGLRELWANPSSGHRPGQRVRQAVDLARASIARLIDAEPREIVFTAGGTEAVALAIRGSLEARPDRSVVVTTRTEHSAVRDLADVLEGRGVEILRLPVDGHGVLDLDALDRVLRERASEIALVSVMWANNETGVIQPIEAIAARCRDAGVRFHTDATQWVGKMPTFVAEIPVDLLNFSAHKFHGPKGVGALYVRRGIRIAAQLVGHQEMQRRAGTENVPGILGFGVAADEAARWLATDGRERVAGLRDDFERRLLDRVPGTSVNGGGAARLWSTANVAFAGLEAEAMLMLLSERGLCASGGAACASGAVEPSPVLLAMGVSPERAAGSIRFSLGRETTREEIDAALEIIAQVGDRLRPAGDGGAIDP